MRAVDRAGVQTRPIHRIWIWAVGAGLSISKRLNGGHGLYKTLFLQLIFIFYFLFLFLFFLIFFFSILSIRFYIAISFSKFLCCSQPPV